MGLTLFYYKRKLKNLMQEYYDKLKSVECGYQLASYMFNVKDLEDQMDVCIEAINKLDNKQFKTFKEGYVPEWRIN